MKYFTIALCILLLCACSDSGEPDSRPKQAQTTIIFDTDLISSTDDLVALCALYKYMDEGKCNVIGIVVDREGEANAACADVFNTFYGHPEIPIALVRNGIKNPDVFIDYSGVAHWQDDRGNQLFRRSIADYSALPDGYELYRSLLQSAPDKSVTIVSVGFLTALAQLLTSDGGQQLVVDKVKAIYIMGGCFNSGLPDYNFAQGPQFAQTFFKLWPESTPIYFSPSEVGNGIYYSKQQLLDDFANSGLHPLKEIYQRFDEDKTQMMWDMLPVIHAVEGDQWFSLSQWGYVTIDSEGNTSFTPSSTGNCRYQLPGDHAWNVATLNKIRGLIIP
ncbi:MAG: nucleoside hydrolase [Muribaculaceae bacterium]